MKSTSIHSTNGGYIGETIHVEGLAETLKFLRRVDPELEKAIFNALKDSANPVLSRAKSNASKIADDGTFRDSLSIAAKRAGIKIQLKSNDPAAGVKEYARRGAVTIKSKGTALANARLAKKSGVGVPAGNPPRVMIPAVEESIEEVKARIDAAIERIFKGGLNG